MIIVPSPLTSTQPDFHAVVNRITNTVEAANGITVFRPSAISAFPGLMPSVESWWPLWVHFMFHQEVQLPNPQVCNIFSLLEPISRCKYPDLSPREEEVSLALQTLALAIFDSILVHVLQTVGGTTWQVGF